MRILKIHIENYGKIKNKDIMLSDGLNSYTMENGEGKTTIASFIRAMLYGLDNVRANTKGFPDRTHFYPFDGGKFGGNMIVEAGKETYRIERFFSQKSKTKDVCRVYDGRGREIPDAENIGEKLLALDAVSFDRCVFFTSEDTDTEIPTDMGARFLDEAGGTAGKNDFKKAVALLDGKMRELKSSGTRGKIFETEKDISELRRQLDDCEKMKTGLEKIYSSISDYKEKLRNCRKEVEAQHNYALMIEKMQTYLTAKKDLSFKKDQLKRMHDKYPGGIPTAEELKELARLSDCINARTNTIETMTRADDKSDQIEKYERMFESGIPSADIISQTENYISEYEQLCAMTEKEPKITGEHELLRDRFGKAVGLDSLIIKIEDETKKNLSGGISERDVRPKGNKLFIAGTVLALSIAVLGGISFIFNTYLAIVMLSLGIVGGVVSSFAYLNSKMSSFSGMSRKNGIEDSTNTSLLKFIAPYGYGYGETGLFVADYERYKRLEKEYYDSVKEYEDRTERKKCICRKIDEFLSVYRIEEVSFTSALGKLREYIADYRRLLSEKESNEIGISKNRKAIYDARKKVEEIMSAYSDRELTEKMPDTEQMMSDRKVMEALEADVLALQKREEEFRPDVDLSSVEKPKNDIEELKKREEALNSEIARLEREASEYEECTERIPEIQEEIARKQEKAEEMKKRYDTLLMTSRYLYAAQNRLKDKYRSPMKTSFIKYADMTDKELFSSMTMDEDFNTYYERDGENRSDKHFSKGERTLCALCIRLALLDNLFEKERPFIVMDDPFSELDAAHFAVVREMMLKLSDNMQIIYFTCHESRRMT